MSPFARSRKALEASDLPIELATAIADLSEAAAKFRDAFDYDPGQSDLDDSQPITIFVTLGDWRRLNRLLPAAGKEHQK